MFGAVAATLGACSPPRIILPDSSPPADVPEVDSGLPGMDASPDATVRRDAAMDSTAADVATTCDPDRCFDDCVGMGGVTGRCMMNVCTCRFPDGGAPVTDSGREGGSLVDVVRESSVRSCMVNSDCPPTMFCSAPSCSGAGQCLLRQESDPNRCLPDPTPSCGCDGLLYPSACARTVIGVRQDPMSACNGDAAVIPASDSGSRD